MARRDRANRNLAAVNLNPARDLVAGRFTMDDRMDDTPHAAQVSVMTGGRGRTS